MINKIAVCTDLHLGRKNNSEIHNQDCLNFIDWFCENVRKDTTIQAIAFLGDWHENRAAINALTLSYSYQAAKKLNDVGLPIYFIVGNHDLYYRDSRQTYSTEVFQSLKNFIIIDKDPVIVNELGPNGSLFSPYLFSNEYSELSKYSKIPVWFLHAEFKGFVITGETKKMEHGPDATNFSKPKHIFTGHFHKRQNQGNVQYVGSCFPMDFADANDSARGMMTYDYMKDEVKFIDWIECPMYIRTSLSELLGDNPPTIPKKAVVRCLADVDITLDESNVIREKYTAQYNLREFSFEETLEMTEALKGTESDISGMTFESTTGMVTELLSRISVEKIEPTKLIEIYKAL